MLWRTKFCVVGGSLALLIFGAGTAGAHSVYEAEQTLYQRGYSDIRVERASLPYSFNACRRRRSLSYPRRLQRRPRTSRRDGSLLR